MLLAYGLELADVKAVEGSNQVVERNEVLQLRILEHGHEVLDFILADRITEVLVFVFSRCVRQAGLRRILLLLSQLLAIIICNQLIELLENVLRLDYLGIGPLLLISFLHFRALVDYDENFPLEKLTDCQLLRIWVLSFQEFGHTANEFARDIDNHLERLHV